MPILTPYTAKATVLQSEGLENGAGLTIARPHSDKLGAINAVHLSHSPPGYWLELSTRCLFRECPAEAANEAFLLATFLIESEVAR